MFEILCRAMSIVMNASLLTMIERLIVWLIPERWSF